MNYEVVRKLSDIVRRQNEITELINQFRITISEYTLAHFVTSAIIIGIAVIGVIMVYPKCVV